MAPRETENNAYAKFLGDKQRALWYVMAFSGVVNWFINKPMLALIKPVQHWKTRLTSRMFGLRRRQRLDKIQAELPFLLLTRENKRRFLLQGATTWTVLFTVSKWYGFIQPIQICIITYGMSNYCLSKFTYAFIAFSSANATFKSSSTTAR